MGKTREFEATRGRGGGGGRLALPTALVLGVVAGVCSPADSAELKIADVKAYLFLERAGRLSDDILGAQALVNAPKGGAPGGDTATAVLIDFTFEGDRNAAPKYATATVDLTQTKGDGARVVTHKAFTGFVFGADGVEHKALFLEGATCTPLAIEVHAGHTSKSAHVDFQCDMVRASN